MCIWNIHKRNNSNMIWCGSRSQNKRDASKQAPTYNRHTTYITCLLYIDYRVVFIYSRSWRWVTLRSWRLNLCQSPSHVLPQCGDGNELKGTAQLSCEGLSIVLKKKQNYLLQQKSPEQFAPSNLRMRKARRSHIGWASSRRVTLLSISIYMNVSNLIYNIITSCSCSYKTILAFLWDAHLFMGPPNNL